MFFRCNFAWGKIRTDYRVSDQSMGRVNSNIAEISLWKENDYSDTNIRTHTLLEALQAPLFTAYKEGQPWNENHLRPCPLLDNPHALVDAVEKSGAHSTDLQDPENVRDLAVKCEGPAERWAPVADELWACKHDCAGCAACGQKD